MALLNEQSGINLDEHTIKLAVGIITIGVNCWASWGLPKDRADSLIAAVTAIGSLLIGGISYAQGKKYTAQGAIESAKQGPAVQTNVNSDVSNSPAAPAKPTPPPPPPPAQSPQVVVKLDYVALAKAFQQANAEAQAATKG